LHDVWLSPALVDYMYIFGGSCPLMQFCPVQNSLYVQVLHFPILAALVHGTPAAGISQTLRCGTRNGIMELPQRAPPIFGWVAITLGISPHSSLIMIYCKPRSCLAKPMIPSFTVCLRIIEMFWSHFYHRETIFYCLSERMCYSVDIPCTRM